jgi:hypothetical protein
MTEKYVLHLKGDQNGFYDVHKTKCIHVPKRDCIAIGEFAAPASAVVAAKLKYPYKTIKGCYFCAGAW